MKCGRLGEKFLIDRLRHHSLFYVLYIEGIFAETRIYYIKLDNSTLEIISSLFTPNDCGILLLVTYLMSLRTVLWQLKH